MNSFNNFNNLPLAPAVKALFDELNIPLNSTVNEAIKPQDILEDYYKPNDEAQSLINDVYFLGMVDDQAFNQQSMLFGSQEWTAAQAKNLNSDYDGLVVLAVALKARPNSLLPTRGQLADISRVFNRAFSSTPVTIVFKYDEYIALANSERISKKNNDGEKIGKVSLLKDISLNKTHTGHTRILTELAITSAGTKAVTTFAGLYKHWQSVLSVSTLNKQFYQKLFNWYLWALPQAKFPQIRPESDMIPDEQHQSESLIRLLTRLLFVWFMKEKGLINSQLFDRQDLKSVLNQDFFANDGQNTIYYKAVLQNLFFATLNKPIQQRKAIDKGFNPKEYGDALIYRFAELFKNEASFLSHFDNIPFLNGGLFDCLDKRKDNTNPTEIRLDGFSTQKKKQAVLPDVLFFGEYKDVDLSSAYDDKKKKKETVYGLVDILHQYKFTIEENTPQDEEIALDPELLGKVFENLLASYNPETKTTARKQTGSFYTPREIVDYMVDESLIAYFLAHLHDASEEENRSRLQKLLDYSYHYDTHHHLFNDDERTVIILKLNDLTLLDPACGSGAFPMGALNKLVLVLKRLDPDNALWKRQNSIRLTSNLARAQQSKNTSAIDHASAELDKLELSFSEASQDYPRKLYLIERCIYGIDIQPIATQIAKLRFFISLLVDQSDKPNKVNRGFEPLPNLDFKLVTANTLIAAPESHNSNDMFARVQDDFFVQFEQKTHEYFNTHTPQEKEHKKQSIEKLIDQKCAEKKQEIESFFNNKNPATQKALKAKYKDVIAQKESDLRLWESYKNIFKHEAVGFFDVNYFFPQVKNGFDVVIGNPPYGASYSTAQKNYFLSSYQSAKSIKGVQKGSIDTFSLFTEKGLSFCNSQAALAYIVPLAITSSDAVTGLHNLILKCCETVAISTYSNRPRKIFDSADQRVAIVVLQKNNKPIKNLLSTKVNKRYENTSIQDVIDNLKFVNSLEFAKYGRFPKVGSQIELNILKNIFESTKNKILNLMDKCGSPVYYRTSGGRYYNIITNYSTGSTKENILSIKKDYSNLTGAILSSNLYYWFYNIYSNNLDLKTYELEIMPIPVEKFSIEEIKNIEFLYDEYLRDLENNARVIQADYATISSFKEYRARKSKHLIDKMDLAIQKAYGLSDEEINFIINYDLEFRTDD